MMKKNLLVILISFLGLPCFAQYKSYESLSLFVPNISERGQLLASVNVPFAYSEIGIAYAPMNNVVVQTAAHFGSMRNRATEFTQTIGIGLTKKAGNYFFFGFRGLLGYHKYFFQDVSAPLSDIPVYSPAIISNNRRVFFNYYQYNSGSIQGDITIATPLCQFTFASALTRLHYTYLRIFQSSEMGLEERYDFYETHATIDFGIRYFINDNLALTANFGARNLIRATSPIQDRLSTQTLELAYANIGGVLIINTKRNREQKKANDTSFASPEL
jgi:hypothetical protein